MAFPSTIQFQGRWVLDDDKRYATWCGSSLHFRTSSRSICLELGDSTQPRKSHPNLLWSFGCGSQSETYTKRVKGPCKVTLVPKADAGGELHDVTVMLCEWGATLHVLNVYTTDGRSILAPKLGAPVRPMLFIGASLVSGYSPPFRGVILQQGTYQAFAFVAAHKLRERGLDVRLEMVAFPGPNRSLFVQYRPIDVITFTGLRLTTTEYDKGMEDIFWDGNNGDDGWDTRPKNSPEDIFICLGTNDRAWGEETGVFLERYKAFLTRLRDSYHASCKRIYAISPFRVFDDGSLAENRTVYEPDVQHMVEGLAKSWSSSDPTGPKVYHISTEGWIDTSLTCDHLHPTAEGHERIGTKLVEFLDSQGVL